MIGWCCSSTDSDTLMTASVEWLAKSNTTTHRQCEYSVEKLKIKGSLESYAISGNADGCDHWPCKRCFVDIFSTTSQFSISSDAVVAKCWRQCAPYMHQQCYSWGKIATIERRRLASQLRAEWWWCGCQEGRKLLLLHLYSSRSRRKEEHKWRWWLTRVNWVREIDVHRQWRRKRSTAQSVGWSKKSISAITGYE